MTQQIAIGPDIKVRAREFKARILEAEAKVLSDPCEANLANLTDILEESRRFREDLKGG